MKILHLSDTHSQHGLLKDLPEADVVVHSGDFTFAGSEAEAYDFMNWFCDLSYRHKIFIAGNHDDCMYGAENIEGLPNDVHYLCNSGVAIDGLKFYGVPMFMQDDIEGKYPELFSKISLTCDVLITHQPPYGICDLSDYGRGVTHRGNSDLRERIEQLHLKAHLFGHEHDAYDHVQVNQTQFSNGSVLDNLYRWVNNPRLIEL